MMNWKKTVLLFMSSLLLVSCGTQEGLVSKEMMGSVKEPGRLRIAILPFDMPHSVNRKDADYIRRRVFINLKRGRFNLVEKFIVDGIIDQNDWGVSNLREIAPQRLGEALGADAILYGKITSWEKSYLAIHASITIGAKIRLVDARTGEVLWKSDCKKTDFDGLFKVPTGISSAIISPILYVTKKENQYRIADEVAQEMTAYLINPQTTEPPLLFKKRVLMASSRDALTEIIDWGGQEPAYQGSLFEEEEAVRAEDAGEMLASAKSAIPQPESMAIEKEETPATNPVSLPKPQRAATPASQPKQSPGQPEPPVMAKKETARYTIQVGSYQQRHGAEELIRTLQMEGITAFISEALVKDKKWFRVQVSSFATAKDAKRYALKSIKAKDMPYFITTVSATAKG